MQTLKPREPLPNSDSNIKTDFEKDDVVPLLDDAEDDQESKADEANDKEEIDTKESITPSTESESLADKDDDNDSDETADAPSTAELDKALGLTDEGILNLNSQRSFP